VDEELQQINTDYDRQLQSLDTKTKTIIIYFLLYVSKNVLQGDFNAAKYKLLNTAISTLNASFLALIQENIQLATKVSQQLIDVQLQSFKTEVERLLNAKKAEKTVKIAILSSILVKLAESEKQRAIDSIMNKKWPDELKVIDRIELLGKKIKQITENTIIQGKITGLSPDDLINQLRSRFIDGGIEQRAALRLAVHTTNMVKEKTFAELAKKSNAIIGIHIMRGAGGSVKCQICPEHAGEVGGSGIIYLKEDGDLDIMAEMPPYHGRCLCYEVLIFKDVETFIEDEEQKFARQNILKGEYNLKINQGKQNRHIEGTREFKEYAEKMALKGDKPSILMIDAQGIIDKYSGSGRMIIQSPGRPPKESKQLDFITGKYYNKVENEYINTSRVLIIYAKTGAHVYPVKE